METMFLHNGAYWIIFIVFMILSWVVSARLKSKFRTYSKVPIASGMTGRDVAEKMLRDSGVTDVTVHSVAGELTDHYNPLKKTINLSRDVYSGASVAAAAVAAHETGHALQHAQSYAWLGMRSKLAPVVSFASNWIQWVLIAGLVLLNSRPEIHADRNSAFCHYHTVQLHHPPGGDQCVEEGTGMAFKCRHNIFGNR
jgi:uncharacterized protein